MLHRPDISRVSDSMNKGTFLKARVFDKVFSYRDSNMLWIFQMDVRNFARFLPTRSGVRGPCQHSRFSQPLCQFERVANFDKVVSKCLTKLMCTMARNFFSMCKSCHPFTL